MEHHRSIRLGVGIMAAGLGALAIGASAATAAHGVAAAGQATVTGTLITRPARTLAPGTSVRAGALVSQRVFVDAGHGFALAGVGQAQYPAATTDGGHTWRTDGPALHLDAAQAPLAVTEIGAAGRRTVFAYGSGQVIDTTSDGGKHWYRALFNGQPMAVVRDAFGHLVAFVDGETGGTGTWQYVSKNGGRTWHHDSTVGGS
jgi:photosystem II stability/assembly factor-like uncharacterized protein